MSNENNGFEQLRNLAASAKDASESTPKQEARSEEPVRQAPTSLDWTDLTNNAATQGVAAVGTSASISAIAEKATKYTDSLRGNTESQVIVLDNATHDFLAVGVVCIVTAIKDISGVVAVHPLLIANTQRYPLYTTVDQSGRDSYDILTGADAAYDDSMIDYIIDQVKRQYPGKEVIVTEGQVVHRFVTVDESSALRNQINQGISYNANALMDDAGTSQTINVAMDNGQSQLTTTMEYVAGRQLNSIDGLPVRADLTLNLTSSRTNQRSVGVNSSLNGTTRQVLGALSGYYDVYYSEPDQVVTRRGDAVPVFQPALVLTDVRTYNDS